MPRASLKVAARASSLDAPVATACQHFVSASIFPVMSLPSAERATSLARGVGVDRHDVQFQLPLVPCNQDGLCDLIAGAYVNRVTRHTHDEVNWAGVPIGLNQAGDD